MTACTPPRSCRSYQPSRVSGGTSVVSTTTRIPSFKRICSSLRVTSRFCVYTAQIWRCRYEELFPPLSFRVKFPSIQIAVAKWPVGIKQQGVQGYTHHRLIPAMLLQCGLHVLFKFLVGFFQGRVHLDANDLLPVGRQRLGNILERNECPQAHQKAAEEQR